MTRARLRPRDRLDPRHPDGFGDGSPGWRLPHDIARLSRQEQDRELWQVVAAASQHHHAYAFDQARLDSPRRPTLKAHCAAWGYDARRMADVLRGDAPMHHSDWVFALRSLGPAAVVPPSDLVPAIDFAAETATAAAGGLGSRLRSRITAEQVLAMEALGDGGGAVTIGREPTQEEAQGMSRNQRLAPPLVEAAARRLRDRPGFRTTDLVVLYDDASLRPVQPVWQAEGSDNRVEIDLLRDEAGETTARGSADEDGFVVTVWLRPDWAAKVHDAGHSLIDGWFVADTWAHANGRPTMARVLDLVPRRGDITQRDDGTYVADHEYRTRTVAITWTGDRPSIGRAPEDPSQP